MITAVQIEAKQRQTNDNTMKKRKAEEYEEDGSDDSSEEVEESSNAEEESDDVVEQRQSESEAEDNDADNEADINDDQKQQRQTTGYSTEQCTFDLRNLVAVNSHQLDATSLYASNKKNKPETDITIPPTVAGIQVDEGQLLEKAQDGCSQLISALWQLPTETSDAGPLVTLPSYFEIKIPRALPPPPPKKETKWEKFAKERGIGINQEKRSRKVWDEVTGEWKYRHGYQKANNDAQEWPIMEVKGNDDPYEDPWEKLRDAKRSRVEKNMENRMRNQEHAGQLPKGTATRVIKSRASSRQAGKAGGNKDRDGVLPAGVPVDLKANKASGAIASKKRGKESTMAALVATQRSTASLGKFDQVREGEPERKKALASLKKRKFESSTDRKVVSTEAERGMKLLNAVMSGGGAAREKAKRNGSLARGETAYDYDFDDGLGASTYRKKKGRAGMGKLKKITKKRVK